MTKTEQRSLRLSYYHLKIVEELEKEKGFTFTDAIKFIISQYEKNRNIENNIHRLIQKMEKQIAGGCFKI